MGFTALSDWFPETVRRGLPELQCTEATTRYAYMQFLVFTMLLRCPKLATCILFDILELTS